MGISADPSETLLEFRERRAGGFRQVSDPHLRSAEALDVAVSGSLHPMSHTYPEGAFLQPAYFVVDREGVIKHAWRQVPGLANGYGAMRRPSPEVMLEEARAALARQADVNVGAPTA